MKAPDLEVTGGQHLVLKRKHNGKISSRKDQSKMAMQLEAVLLTEGGKGGGIVSLLLPKTTQAHAVMVAIREIYELSRVKARPGKKAGTTDRQALRVALQNDVLICRLAILYEAHIVSKPGPQATSAKAFIGWLKRELCKTKSHAYQAVSSLSPRLLDVPRSDRWWADALAQRRKRRVRDISN